MPSVADEDRFPTVGLSGYRYRLIPSRFPTIDIYRRIAPRPQWPLAQRVETITNPRLRLKEKLTHGVEGLAETSPKLQNWNHAPYAYRNPSGSRFLGPSYGVLELSDSVQTALAASIRRREAFLEACGSPSIDLEMRVLKHEVKGHFTDLTSLADDVSECDRWRLGERLLQQGTAGVQFRSPVRGAGVELAIFDNDALGPSIQTQHFKFHWDGEAITEIYAFRDDADGRPIFAEDIFADQPLPV
jgi:hypothetical protein